MAQPQRVPEKGSPLSADIVRWTARAEPRLSDLIDDLTPMQRAVDVRDLWAGLARALVRTMRADACLISIVDDDGILRDVAASVVPPALLNHVVEEYVLADYPVTKGVLETGNSVEISINDPDSNQRERTSLADLGFARLMICQLAIDDKPIGILEIYRLLDRPFRQDDDKHVATLCEFATNAYKRIHLTERMEKHYTDTLSALASALEAKDPYTQEHTNRIRELALALGEAMQVPAETRRALSLGAILHDVGKIGIADSILLKPAALTDDEWVVMRRHPIIGERMLRDIEFMRPALPIIRHHHERWDGKGYPDRLKGEEIPVGARIVAVCDSFDAMTTDRPYRKSMSVKAACDELLAHAGTQFDPTCVALAVQVISKMGEDHLDERFVRYASA